jgi:hypothetical protein
MPTLWLLTIERTTMKKQTTATTTKSTSLIGRGALIRQLASEQTPLALFISTVRAKYPVCGTAWCEKHYRKAMQRIAKKTEKTTPAPAPAPAVPEKSTKRGKKSTVKA